MFLHFIQQINFLLKKKLIIEIFVLKNIILTKEIYLFLLFLEKQGILNYFLYDSKTKLLSLKFNHVLVQHGHLKAIRFLKKTMYFNKTIFSFKKTNCLFINVQTLHFLSQKLWFSSWRKISYLVLVF